MPLLQVQKASRRIPSWAKGSKKSPEGRAAIAIIGRNETRFSRAFLKTMRDLYATEYMNQLKRAIRSGEQSIERILDAVPWYNEADPESVAFWTRLADSAARAYESTIVDSGTYTARRYRFPMKFTVAKQVDLVVPINTASTEWIRNKSASLVKEISGGQRNKLRKVLSRNFERGIRPEGIIAEIEAVVGLTETQTGWVLARQDLAIARGIPAKEARRQAKDFGQKLLTQRAKSIARTETIDAHSQGLKDTWRMAKDNGFMPPGAEKVWEALEDERTSEICEELNGQAVPVDQFFFSSIVGPIEKPPAHPNCRSTMTLRFP